MPHRLMAVHAHPDDESSKGAATLAHYAARGDEVMVVSCTGGERGDILNDALVARSHAERDLPGLRRTEMAGAQAALGVQHRWLGYFDSGMRSEDGSLPDGCFAGIPLETSAEPLVALVRAFRPHVIVTYDENGGYPHPDHIRCHEVSMEAYRAAADPERYPTAGPAWSVSKLYYDRAFSYQKMSALIEALRAEEPTSPRLAEIEERGRWLEESPFLATSQIQVGDYFEARDAALRSHSSQVPESAFFFWPNDLQRRVWPWEDFQLAQSRVESALPETDLFAGIEED